jgi:hypothetical protein
LEIIEMEEKLVSRRAVLRRSAEVAIAAAFGAVGCGKSEPKALSCADTLGLSATDVQVRTALAYVDTSVEPGKSCATCQQFQPGAPGACGTCKVVKGSINPSGSCRSFLAKPPA